MDNHFIRGKEHTLYLPSIFIERNKRQFLWRRCELAGIMASHPLIVQGFDGYIHELFESLKFHKDIL
jgi:hypothetical protein